MKLLETFVDEILKGYSNKKFLIVTLIMAALLWLLMGGIVEAFYNYVNPNTTIRQVKEVSFVWKNWFAVICFVGLWLWRWSHFRLINK